MADTRELSVSVFIDAPPAKVWDVMTNRQEEWWCPEPWSITIEEQDRRAGGRCAMTMHGPDGETVASEGIFLAWEEGRRFVTTDAIVGPDFDPAGPFMIGFWEIEPEEAGGVSGTRFTGRAKHWSDEARSQHEQMGFVEGWGTVAEQLKALCEA